MKDKLFNALENNILEFISIGNKSFLALSESGVEDKKNNQLEGPQNFWKKVIEKTSVKYEQLKLILIKSNDPMENEELNIALDYFRTISRWISESPPEWSAYYDEINNAIGNLYLTRRKIDDKYELGEHMFRKKIEFYQNQNNSQ